MEYGVIWKSEREEQIKNEINILVAEKTRNVFEMFKQSSEFSNRFLQCIMSMKVINTLRNGDVLLEEAGVGIGKTFAYLIPTLFYIDEYRKRGMDYRPFIISTSSKSLQKQLLDDINNLTEILGIEPIDATISMGVRNYVCEKNITKVLDKIPNSDKRHKELQRLYQEHNFGRKVDKSKYKISSSLWKKIGASHPEACNSCKYCAKCQLPSELKRHKNADILVMNHGYLTALAMQNDELVKFASSIVIDEGHKLEESIRSTATEKYQMGIFYDVIKRIVSRVVLPAYQKEDGIENYQDNVIGLFETFYNTLRKTADNYFRRHNDSGLTFTECEEVSLDIKVFLNKKHYAYQDLLNLYNGLDDLIKRVDKNKYKFKYPSIDKDLEDLLEFHKCLLDLGTNQDYIYSVELFKNNNKTKVNLLRTPKDISKIVSNILDNKPVVITSATLTANTPNDRSCGYDNFERRLGIQNRTGVTEDVPKPSPYDYENNTLLYCNTSLPSPTDRTVPHDTYIEKVASNIDELIIASGGKSLVLFTNKKDMEQAYNFLKTYGEYPFDLLIQRENNGNSVIEDFRNNTNSVLFSASAWEGIDIPGESLSQVIITRLPYPVSDAVVEELSKDFKPKEAYNQFIYPAMIAKLKQGLGRLIRSENDTGIWSILDSRISNQFDSITAVFPGGRPTNITNNIKDIGDFVVNKQNYYVKKRTMI